MSTSTTLPICPAHMSRPLTQAVESAKCRTLHNALRVVYAPSILAVHETVLPHTRCTVSFADTRVRASLEDYYSAVCETLVSACSRLAGMQRR